MSLFHPSSSVSYGCQKGPSLNFIYLFISTPHILHPHLSFIFLIFMLLSSPVCVCHVNRASRSLSERIPHSRTGLMLPKTDGESDCDKLCGAWACSAPRCVCSALPVPLRAHRLISSSSPFFWLKGIYTIPTQSSMANGSINCSARTQLTTSTYPAILSSSKKKQNGFTTYGCRREHDFPNLLKLICVCLGNCVTAHAVRSGGCGRMSSPLLAFRNRFGDMSYLLFSSSRASVTTHQSVCALRKG